MYFSSQGTSVTQEVNGQSCLVQAEGSEVSLQVPEGVNGTIIGKTHTDNAKFVHLIDDNECLVSPVSEFNLEGKSNQDGNNFKVKIPHIIKDVEKAKKHIKVKHRNIHSQATATVGFKRKKKQSGQMVMKKRKDSLEGDAWYDVDNKFVTIETRELGMFIVTVEGLNCCSDSATCFVFGSLKYFPDKKSLATLKAYFWSIHGRIKDYEMVGMPFVLTPWKFQHQITKM